MIECGSEKAELALRCVLDKPTDIMIRQKGNENALIVCFCREGSGTTILPVSIFVKIFICA